MERSPIMKNYYQVLGLPFNASPRRIRDQYRKLAKRYHPDTRINSADKAHFEEKFKEINEAYRALSEITKQTNLTPQQRKLDFLYQQGKKLFDQRKYSKALIFFNEVLTLDAAYRDTHIRLQEARRKHQYISAEYAKASSFFRHKKWAEAMASFETVLREDPHYRDAAKRFKAARREQLMANFMEQY